VDISVGDLINGGAGLAALYLANQIKTMLEALKAEMHELKGRVVKLEQARDTRQKKPKAKSGRWH
jgi:hypothetical protein